MTIAEFQRRGVVRLSLPASLRQIRQPLGTERAQALGMSVPAAIGATRGVRVGWLADTFAPLVEQRLGRSATTADVCFQIVIPHSRERSCRYVEQLDDADVGPSDAFASHCWGASFLDLVAALRHVLEPDQYVWIDIFAVLQHEHTEELKAIKQGDLDFAPVVQGCPMLILFGAHLDSVEDMGEIEVLTQKMHLVPAEERKRCAFLRVWCLVELAAALAAALPVVMLVGEADSQGKFEPDDGMLDNMYYLVDIDLAEATLASDVEKIFDEIMPQVLGASSRSECVTRINELAKGAVNGAKQIMWYREVVQAAAGNMAPLRALSRKEAHQALRAAASAGLLSPMRELISMGVNVSQHSIHRDEDTSFSPLSRLRENDWNVRKAIFDWRIARAGTLPLTRAAQGGHTRAIEVLLQAKADPNQELKVQGATALHQAAVGEHKGAMEVLLRAGANPNIAEPVEGTTALVQMAGAGNCELLQLLLDAKADLQHACMDGQTGQPPNRTLFPCSPLGHSLTFCVPAHSTPRCCLKQQDCGDRDVGRQRIACGRTGQGGHDAIPTSCK